MIVAEFDYIVVGAGSAGCVIASRLSERPDVRVLLIEAGSGERSRAMIVPNEWPDLLGSAADWAYETTDQADAGATAYPRGKTLGGSSSINAMAHVRGHRAIYDGGPRVALPAGASPSCCRTSNGQSRPKGVILHCVAPMARSG